MKKTPIALLAVASAAAAQVYWTHLSSARGELPIPPVGPEPTASLTLDIDKDGDEDILIAGRQEAPSVVWYRRGPGGWTRYLIDNTFLRIEAGGAFHDIDGDGDPDIVFGADAGDNKIWWWENPYPNYSPAANWTRRLIKSSGGNKHHDQIFGDFDGDGHVELVSWNQGGKALLRFEIPQDPRKAEVWPSTPIYTWTEGPEHEGLAAGDINGDGKLDLVGGGRWFEHKGGANFAAHVIDDAYRFSRAAVGDLKKGGRPEAVFGPGDNVLRLKWFEWTDGKWAGHDLLPFDVNHGHSLRSGDVNKDGNLDVFAAEMAKWGREGVDHPDARMWVLYGDGKGGFRTQEISRGQGTHEARLADLDGDGYLDILSKPFRHNGPRLEVWLNKGARKLALDQWQRHVIDPEKPWRAIFIGAADLDGDTRRDIVTGGWWYRNPGSPGGRWERKTIGEPLRNMAALYDFDGDGRIDVLGTQGRASEANAAFVLARNSGSGSFTLQDLVTTAGDFLQGIAVTRFTLRGPIEAALSWHQAGHGLQTITFPGGEWRKISDVSQDEALSWGDIDRDGDMDLLLGTKWLRNDGGSWSAHAVHPTPGDPDRNVLADINRNGRLDAVVGFEAINVPGKLAWYEQGSDATGTWTEHVIAQVVGPMSLDARDMDGDGDFDVVVGEHNYKAPQTARLLIFENVDGKGGSWKEHVVHTGDEHHDGAHVLDIDGDGDLDIISIGWSHGRVLLYENRSVAR
jgi:hypothetical protein